ncbi:MAG: cytochrome c peroxidase [Bacteriovoracaceae bacterium]|jgi:cytochrome c peroxidase
MNYFKIFTTFLVVGISTQIFAVDNKYELGRLLFFDKILSGNKNISCATCHHPLSGFSSDNLSLGLGEGASGLAVSRVPNDKIHHRVPRNSPALFNAGNTSFINYFHDGRIEKNSKYPSGVKSPAGFDLPEGLDSILAVQALFPVTSDVEMAGQPNENIIGRFAANGDIKSIWNELVVRVTSIPEYMNLFKDAFSDVSSVQNVGPRHIANAIAHFEEKAFTANDAPFDRYILGDRSALNNDQVKGMKIFYSKGQCSKCHSGSLMTDNLFHSIAIPPIGPGKGVGFKSQDDYGRELVTGEVKDRYKFRTPSLRNVVVTGPWGHNGAYNNLKEIINHHLNPKKSLHNYSIKKALLPKLKDAKDNLVLKDSETMNAIAESADIKEIKISNHEVDLVIKFLYSLTDERCLDMRNIIPLRVPSNLPIHD